MRKEVTIKIPKDIKIDLNTLKRGGILIAFCKYGSYWRAIKDNKMFDFYSNTNSFTTEKEALQFMRKGINSVFDKLEYKILKDFEEKIVDKSPIITKDLVEFYHWYNLKTTKNCIDIINKEYKKGNWKRVAKVNLCDETYRVFKNELNEIITICNEGIFLNYNIKDDLNLIKTIVFAFRHHLPSDYLDIQYNPIIKKVHISFDDGGYAIVTDKQKILLKQEKIELIDIWNTEEHELIEKDFINSLKINYNLDYESDAEYNEEFPYIKIGSIINKF